MEDFPSEPGNWNGINGYLKRSGLLTCGHSMNPETKSKFWKLGNLWALNTVTRKHGHVVL
jgi:hypothetical protein